VAPEIQTDIQLFLTAVSSVAAAVAAVYGVKNHVTGVDTNQKVTANPPTPQKD
jgi:hypothetical protein